MNLRRACFLGLLLTLLGAAARAHPVAQGAMTIVMAPDAVEIRAEVSNEEAFVEASFGPQEGAAPSLAKLYAQHGGYLLHHIEASADGHRLAGTVAAVVPPENSAPGRMVGYVLRFPLVARPLRKLTLRQNVLSEFVFAPGNPWEATYIVRIEEGARILREGLLFTRREPLVWQADATGADKAAPTVGEELGAMARAFLWQGILHILSGYDHLLFIASLVLATVGLRDLVKVITAFTVAHTITLTLSVLDWVRLPGTIVEPMIAASIVFVAAENVFALQRARGWGRIAVAFGFGLFHGLGFAGGLLAAMQGMSHASVAVAIVAFSLGVELGHQVISLPLFFGLRQVRRSAVRHADPERVPRHAIRYASGAIALAGLVYFGAALVMQA